jgi:hypothetical protein
MIASWLNICALVVEMIRSTDLNDGITGEGVYGHPVCNTAALETSLMQRKGNGFPLSGESRTMLRKGI